MERHGVDRLVLGLLPSDRLRERDPRTRAFTRALGERTGIYIVERNVTSYQDLEREMTLAHIDVAWLPPLLFARLERDAVATAVVSRAQARPGYSSVLVSSVDAPVAAADVLRGQRIAWVDPLSASGYVVPRLGLIVRGSDPAHLAGELFAGSHSEAVRCVLEGRTDLAATFAHFDEDGGIVTSAWSEMGLPMDAVRIVARLGDIPLDLIAARTSVPEAMRAALGRALVEMAIDPREGAIVESVFGCRQFELGASASYEALRELLERASDPALGWPTESFESTAPPSAPGG